jgi:hypothetical protein
MDKGEVRQKEKVETPHPLLRRSTGGAFSRIVNEVNGVEYDLCASLGRTCNTAKRSLSDPVLRIRHSGKEIRPYLNIHGVEVFRR